LHRAPIVRRCVYVVGFKNRTSKQKVSRRNFRSIQAVEYDLKNRKRMENDLQRWGTAHIFEERKIEVMTGEVQWGEGVARQSTVTTGW